jgi:hypothetical protein
MQGIKNSSQKKLASYCGEERHGGEVCEGCAVGSPVPTLRRGLPGLVFPSHFLAQKLSFLPLFGSSQKVKMSITVLYK